MKNAKRRALQLTQAGKRIFLTTLRVDQIRAFTKIDQYDAKLDVNDPKQGYQRAAEPARYKKFGNYMIKTPGAIAPTGLLLSSRGASLAFDEVAGLISLNSDTPLHIVDGQHRAEGFNYILNDKGRDEMASFEIPVIIVEGLDKIDEMNQFRIVNGTQKSVRMDLVNMILTQVQMARGDEAVKPADHWKVVVSRTVEILNSDDKGPWVERIIMPNEKAFSEEEVAADPSLEGKRIARATSFMTSLRPIYEYLAEHEFIKGDLTAQAEMMAKYVSEYWQSLAEVMPEAFAKPNDYVIQKTPGLFAMHMVLNKLLKDMYIGRREWKKSEFQHMLKDFTKGCDSNFWSVSDGDAARYGSMKGFAELADEIWTARESVLA